MPAIGFLLAPLYSQTLPYQREFIHFAGCDLTTVNFTAVYHPAPWMGSRKAPSLERECLCLRIDGTAIDFVPARNEKSP